MAELSARDAYLAGREDLRQARWKAAGLLKRGLIQQEALEKTIVDEVLARWRRRIDKGELPQEVS